VYFEDKYDTNVYAPDAHFGYLSLFSDAQVEKVGNPGKKMCKLKEPSDENQTECHEIEPNSSKDRAMRTLKTKFAFENLRQISIAFEQ
jgi:hypothetical protein